VLRVPEIEGQLVSALASLSETPATQPFRTHDILVRTARLDGEYAGYAGFIKIDVEGHEEAVLDGAMKTLRLNRPRMLIEIEERHAPGALARIVDLLAGQHYRRYFQHGARLQPISYFDPPAMQSETSLVRYGNYINNFIFLPDEEAGELVSEINSRSKRIEVRLPRRELASYLN
jgi:hypothetical protein